MSQPAQAILVCHKGEVVKKLDPNDLYTHCDPQSLGFETTDELSGLDEVLGQRRAMDALAFGVDIRQEGYNVFVMGPNGAGKRNMVLQFLRQHVEAGPTPDDWCYVNNFDQPHKPKAISLPAGRGKQFHEDVEHLIDDVRAAMSSAFDSTEYRHQRREIQDSVSRKQQESFDQVTARAREQGIAVIRTPMGIALAPIGKGGEPLGPEEVQNLPDDERSRITRESEMLERELQEIIQSGPQFHRQARRKEKDLHRLVADTTVEPLIEELRQRYHDLPPVLEHLEAIKRDLVENAEQILRLHLDEQEEPSPQDGSLVPQAVEPDIVASALMRRYHVNCVICNKPGSGAPLVFEDHPTHPNLIGRVDYLAQMGTLVADFNLIKPGALHRANGGYLVLEAHKLLMQPYVWESFKRALRAGSIQIESLGQALGLMQTASLEPEPIPLKIKVVLMGEPMIFHLLREYDGDFAELFKIPADFNVSIDRNADSQMLFARLLAGMVKNRKLLPFDRSAVARIIEQSARVAADSGKLSVHMRMIADLLLESHYQGRVRGDGAVTSTDVQKAIDMQVHRSARLSERIREEIQKGSILVDTSGRQAGQVNGLAVFPFGDMLFGRPMRITARARMGSGQVVDIEREAALGEATHSKGVLILSGFISGRYVRKLPLSLQASLVFEQSYGGVAGDSASMAELCALLSAIANAPIYQGIAVTGSVNQLGQAQAIGAVNEKIEGFFDVCAAQGFDGRQGVIIPHANVRHLMLRSDVVQAVKDGAFSVAAVNNVDEVIELLTGMTAGEADENGDYPPDTFNSIVSARLEEFARKRQAFPSGLELRQAA
jgi:predicted ATP-dependent protease